MNPPTRNNQKWTRDEHIIAFNLYWQLPFGQLHHRNPRIIELAGLLGRTPDSVAMKLSNFASLDPSLRQRGISGLRSIAKGVADMWEEFARAPEELAYESERLMAERLGRGIEEVACIDTRDLPPEGIEREAMVRVRVNQGFFRRRIVSAYDFRCCVTGLARTQLLVASHIVPWARDPAHRMNPRNGLCLNALHDRAFDAGFMWVEDGFRIRFSRGLRRKGQPGDAALEWMTSFDGQTLRLPAKFTPDPELLRRHRDAAESRAR